jgi:hypothetical protein
MVPALDERYTFLVHNASNNLDAGTLEHLGTTARVDARVIDTKDNPCYSGFHEGLRTRASLARVCAGLECHNSCEALCRNTGSSSIGHRHNFRVLCPRSFVPALSADGASAIEKNAANTRITPCHGPLGRKFQRTRHRCCQGNSRGVRGVHPVLYST